MLHRIVYCKSILPGEWLSTRLARINKEAGKMDRFQVIPNFWRSLGLEGGTKGAQVVPALTLKVNILVEICLGRLQACSFFQPCKRASSKSCCQRGSWEVCSIFQSNPSGTEDTRPDQPVQQERTEESPRSAGLWNLSVYSECLIWNPKKMNVLIILVKTINHCLLWDVLIDICSAKSQTKKTRLLCCIRDGWRYQNGWIFGKKSKRPFPLPLIFGKSYCKSFPPNTL